MVVAFETNWFAKGKVPGCMESIGKFNTSCTEINGVSSLAVG